MNALTHRLERFALGIGLALALIVGYVAIAAATPAGAASGSSWNMISAYPAGSFGAIVTNPANGDIITVGDDGAVQVIAGSDGTRYGLSMTTGDTYIVAQDVGDEIALALDAAGDVVVGNGNYVEELSIATGSLVTVAGNGTYTAGASGTAATAGGILAFQGVAVDLATGDIIVSDGLTDALRVIAESTAPYMGADGGSALTVGDIYTLANTSASVSVVVDASTGNVLYDAANAVYLDAASTGTYYDVRSTAGTPVVIAGEADSYNETGDVTSSTQTAAPATGATFGDVEGLLLDASGNVFVADGGAAAIRVVAAGTGAASIYGVSPGGGVSDGDLYTVAGTGENGLSTQYAPATSSQLDYPVAEALSGGNVLIDGDEGGLEEIGTPTAPLTPPPGLTTVASAGVLASWQSAPVTALGFQATTSYVVSWYECSSVGSCSGTPAGSAAVPATATSTTISDLDADQLYGFSLAASNPSGTGPASALSYATSGIYAPGPVTDLSATTSSRQMQATWSAPATDGGSAITGYTATLSPCSSSCTESVGAGVTTATFAGLTNGTTYGIAVAAVSGVGSGPPSPVSGTPTGVAGAPTIDSATPGDAVVTLDWAAPGSNGGSPITDYKVVVNGLPIDTLSSATTYTIASLANGDVFSFQVGAVNANGTGPLSAVVHATPATSPSAAPSGIGKSAGDQSATITWSDVPAAGDGGSAITGYLVEALQGSTTVAMTTVAPGTATSTVTGLQNGTAYILEVAAENSVGTGPFATSAAVTPSAVPGSPSSVLATSALDDSGSVALTWAAPADNGSPVTGYEVISTMVGGSALPLIDTGSSSTSYEVPGGELAPGTTYTFAVHAMNRAGYGPSSEPSNQVVSLTVPAAPSLDGTSDATADTDGTVTLAWGAPPSNGATITSYTVAPAPACAACTGLVVIGSPAGTVAKIGGLTLGTGYTFTVTATNEVGTSVPSILSNAVTPATPPAAPLGVTAAAALTGTQPEISVSWSAAAANGSLLTGNTLTATPVGGGAAVTDAVGGAVTMGQITTGLLSGTSYNVTVTATNGTGTGTVSGPPAVVSTDGVPAAPNSVVATQLVPRAASLTWAEPEDNGTPVTSYSVTPEPACPSCEGLLVVGDPAADATTVTGLTVGTAYTFTVSATNLVGTGPASTPSDGVAAASVPNAPFKVVATAGDGLATVTWSSPVPNNSPVTGYTVTARAVDCAAACPESVVTSLTGYPPNTTTVVSELVDGVAYDITVTASNAAGNGPASPAVVAIPSRKQGYWLATAQGHVYGYGGAPSLGAAAAYSLAAPIVGITATSAGGGYWQVGSNGEVFNFGDAGFFGSTASIHLNEPAVGLSVTGDNRGYWIVTSDGGIFGFGDAHFHGSLPQIGVHVRDIVGIVATADGGGYWMVGSDGGVFAFGDARYLGSLPGDGVHVGDIVDFVPTKDNGGYWMVGSNGGVFAFGDAKFVGSLGSSPLASPIVSMTGTPSGRGYWLVSRNGYIFNEGDADNEGSPAGLISGQTVVGIASSG